MNHKFEKKKKTQIHLKIKKLWEKLIKIHEKTNNSKIAKKDIFLNKILKNKSTN